MPVRGGSNNKIPEEQKFLKKANSQQTQKEIEPHQTQIQFQPRQAISAVKPPTYSQNNRGFSDVGSEQQIKFEINHERNNSIEHQQPVRSELNQIQQQQISHSSAKKVNNSKVVAATQSSQQKLNTTQEQYNLQAAENVGADYTLQEEPLQNPQQALTIAIQDLKSSDWQKQFEACNVIRRASLFHSQLFAHNVQVYKELVKPVDSLRSQVSKNACLAMQSLFSNLQARETDPHIDTVLPTLMKRAVDTNQFIAESAEQTLNIIVKNCTDTRVYSSLSQSAIKNNKQKELICYCYTLLIERLAVQGRIRQFNSIDKLVQTIVAMLSEGAAEVRHQAKICLLKLQSAAGHKRELESILQKCHLNERQMEQIQKILKSEDLESLSQYGNTRYGQLSRSPAPLSNIQSKPHGGVSDGFSRRSAGQGGNQMVQTFLSGKESVGPPISIGTFNSPVPPNESIYSVGVEQKQNFGFGGLDNTQSTFKKRTTSVSKPIDRDTLDQFKGLVNNCGQSDWQKRLKAIDDLQDWVEKNSRKVKNSQPGTFIQLVDIYCTLIQDNNAKVQNCAQQSFETVLGNADIAPLLNSNLTMIIQALTQNLCSTSQNVKLQGEQLLNMLEEIVMSESNGTTNGLIQPLISQISLNNCRAKAQLVQRLSIRVDKNVLVERYVTPLLQPNNKIQQEANGNQQLRQALANLEAQIQLLTPGLGHYQQRQT